MKETPNNCSYQKLPCTHILWRSRKIYCEAPHDPHVTTMTSLSCVHPQSLGNSPTANLRFRKIWDWHGSPCPGIVLCAEASCTSAHGPQWRRWRQPKFKWMGSHSRSNRNISWLQTMCAVECSTMQQCSPKSSAAILQDEPPLTAHPAAVDSLQPGPSMLPQPISVRNPSPMTEQSPLSTIF